MRLAKAPTYRVKICFHETKALVGSSFKGNVAVYM